MNRKIQVLMIMVYCLVFTEFSFSNSEKDCGVTAGGGVTIKPIHRKSEDILRYDVGLEFDSYSTKVDPDGSETDDKITQTVGSFRWLHTYGRSSYCPENIPTIGQFTLLIEPSISFSDENQSQESDVLSFDLGGRLPFFYPGWFDPESPNRHSIGLKYNYTEFDFERLNNIGSRIEEDSSTSSLTFDYLFAEQYPLKDRFFDMGLLRFSPGISKNFSSDEENLDSDARFLDFNFTLRKSANLYSGNSAEPKGRLVFFELGPRLYYEKRNYDFGGSNKERYLSGQIQGQVGLDIGEKLGWWVVVDLAAGREDVENHRGQEIDYEDDFVRGGVTFTYLGQCKDCGSSWRPGGGNRRP